MINTVPACVTRIMPETYYKYSKSILVFADQIYATKRHYLEVLFKLMLSGSQKMVQINQKKFVIDV